GDDGVVDVGSPPELFGRLGDGQFRELGEVGARRDRITGEHPVPDRSAACPGRTADGGGGERERTVGDSRVEVDAAVVGFGGDEVVHVARLRIFAEDIVVIGGAGFD